MTQKTTHTDPTTTPIQTGGLFNIFSFFGVITLLIVIWLAHSVFPEVWGHYKEVSEKNFKVEAFRNFMIAVGAAGTVIVGMWGFALAAVRTRALSRQAKTAEDDLALNKEKHAIEKKKHATEMDLAQRRHQSEAFAKAIEQLGHTDFAVRLGAVYALEALARSSKDLHGPIFETLCAYVREKTSTEGVTDLEPTEINSLQAIKKPDVVVQAILTVIGRRDPKRDPDGFNLNLRETNLRRADLRGGHFECAGLENTSLEGAELEGTHLEGAYLNSAHLEGVFLMNAHLEGSHLNEAHLKDAKLYAAHLEGANLGFADLEGAILLGVSFDVETQVSFANFHGAQGIPARPGNDFRATVYGANFADWPGPKELYAWDHGEDDDANKDADGRIKSGPITGHDKSVKLTLKI